MSPSITVKLKAMKLVSTMGETKETFMIKYMSECGFLNVVQDVLLANSPSQVHFEYVLSSLNKFLETVIEK